MVPSRERRVVLQLIYEKPLVHRRRPIYSTAATRFCARANPKSSHFRSSSLPSVQQPLAMKNYGFNRDLKASELFEHPPNQAGVEIVKIVKTFLK